MLGAILGDIIGSPYEFDMGNKSKNFDLFNSKTNFTDDSVMTIAIADALLQCGNDAKEDKLKDIAISSMKKWGRKYPNSGYGGRFVNWLMSNDSNPYRSYGNGSAMRVSSVGWLYSTLEKTREIAKWTAEVTHNHPEGIKGAEATASVIYLARTGSSKNEIKNYIVREFEYDLLRTCDEIRPAYHHVESCQETVPEAITAFLEGNNFEDVIRTAVSLGGDCDTLTCIAGGMAESMYKIPESIMLKGFNMLDNEMKDVVVKFYERRYN